MELGKPLWAQISLKIWNDTHSLLTKDGGRFMLRNKTYRAVRDPVDTQMTEIGGLILEEINV